MEPTGEDNGRGHSEYFESLVNQASLQQLGAWLIALTLIHHRDHTPYSYYSDTAKPGPLFDTATRWGLDPESIKAAVTKPAKSNRTEARHAEGSAKK